MWWKKAQCNGHVMTITSITWPLHGCYMECLSLLPQYITWLITCCLDLLHAALIHYMIHYMLLNQLHPLHAYYMLSLVAVAAAAIVASPSQRDQRARSTQSSFCWIRFVSSALQSVWGPCSIQMRWLRAWSSASGTAQFEQHRWWLGRAVLVVSRIRRLNLQAILPSSKI